MGVRVFGAVDPFLLGGTVRERLIKMLGPAVQTLGYELKKLEYVKESTGRVLRLYIDKPAGITVEDCARVSRQVSQVLDREDPIAENYTLEVSSPGEAMNEEERG